MNVFYLITWNSFLFDYRHLLAITIIVFHRQQKDNVAVNVEHVCVWVSVYLGRIIIIPTKSFKASFNIFNIFCLRSQLLMYGCVCSHAFMLICACLGVWGALCPFACGLVCAFCFWWTLVSVSEMIYFLSFRWFTLFDFYLLTAWAIFILGQICLLVLKCMYLRLCLLTLIWQKRKDRKRSWNEQYFNVWIFLGK